MSGMEKPWELEGNQAARYSPSQKLQISRCYSGIAADYFRNGNVEEAQSAYEKAFKVLLPSLIDSEEVRSILLHEETYVLLNMASCRHKLNAFQDVKEICTRIISHAFDDCMVKASYRRGYIRYLDKDWDGSLEDFDLCLKYINWELGQLKTQTEKRERLKFPGDMLSTLEAQENSSSYLGTVGSDPGLAEFQEETSLLHSQEALHHLKKVVQVLQVKARKQLIIYEKKEKERLSKKWYNLQK